MAILCPGFGDVTFQHLSFMIDGTPEVMSNPIDLHEDLVQVPLPLGVLSHKGGALGSDLTSEERTKSIDPCLDAFMADIDPALMQEIFDITQ